MYGLYFSNIPTKMSIISQLENYRNRKNKMVKTHGVSREVEACKVQKSGVAKKQKSRRSVPQKSERCTTKVGEVYHKSRRSVLPPFLRPLFAIGLSGHKIFLILLIIHDGEFWIRHHVKKNFLKRKKFFVNYLEEITDIKKQ